MEKRDHHTTIITLSVHQPGYWRGEWGKFHSYSCNINQWIAKALETSTDASDGLAITPCITLIQMQRQSAILANNNSEMDGCFRRALTFGKIFEIL